jgi:hypothetical protein
LYADLPTWALGFETLLRERGSGTEELRFLFEPSSRAYQYFKWRILQEQRNLAKESLDV